MASIENKRWLCVDPGETTGWSIFHGETLLGGGQTPLWDFAHDVWDALDQPGSDQVALGTGAQDWLHKGITAKHNVGPLELIVCEKFALYPWAIYDQRSGRPTHALDYDEFRTVQLIGALTFMATLRDVEIHKQPASIKERALAGGAKQMFTRPLHENRHTNDSIMHGFYYIQVECKGVNLMTPDGTRRG